MIKCIKRESSVLVKFLGEKIINISNIKILEKKVNKLVKQKTSAVNICLEGIKFVDSAGIRALMRLNENSRFEGTEIILSDLSAELMDIFLLLKLENRFKIELKSFKDTNRAA